MKARGVNGRSPTELMVRFPSGGHLSLMPKPMYGPSRPLKPLKRLHPAWPTNSYSPSHSGIIDEPTSPKVTCAGRIKVRPNSKPKLRPKSKNWLSVAEMERLQKHLLHLLSSFGSLRFSMKCFGSFDGDDDGDDDDAEENDVFEEEPPPSPQPTPPPPPPPPPDALRLMRSKSEPSKGWAGEDDEETSGGGEEMSSSTSFKMIREEGDDDDDEEEEEEELILMRYGPDFYKLSMDIAKETWVVGSADPLGRSRSWKR